MDVPPAQGGFTEPGCAALCSGGLRPGPNQGGGRGFGSRHPLHARPGLRAGSSRFRGRPSGSRRGRPTPLAWTVC